MAKQYGLIVPEKKGAKKQELGFNSKKNVFGDDSDSDAEETVQKISFNPGDKLKRQARIAQEKVIQEDPTVYQYDELYDSMEQSKKEKITQAKVEKKPRYIEKLLVAAEKRKKENERRVERQVQKEREEEGDKFADKESFVTTSYKNKLEEMRLDEEKERRREYLEELCDVTKQNDLGSFYRHLYNQQVNVKEDETADKDEQDLDKKSVEKSSDKDNTDPERKDGLTETEKKDKAKRSYRKRKHTEEPNPDSDSDDSTMEIKDIKTIKSQSSHLTSNLDADSDFSIDDSSSDDEDGKKTDKDKVEIKKEVEEGDDPNKPDDNFKIPEPPTSTKTDVDDKMQEKEEAVEEPKPKIDIWKKRTVGEVFQSALQRYYERKSKRNL